jgi:ABC-type branched-subunit amino acid transport system permease subunit
VFGVNWRSPTPFYFLCLFWALAGYLLVHWVVRAPFGIALQGIRDNPGAWPRWATAWWRTAWRPMPWRA